MSSLSIRNIGKSFARQPVLAGVGLEVRSGALVAILGRSGSGKTTLLRLIAGFERPDAGEIALDGKLVAGRSAFVPAERRRIGYVAQEGALFPHLRVADNVVFGLPAAARRARRDVGPMLELVGLGAHYADRWPQQLSGGEQQRVALARALAPKPAIVLLDEPFSSLDAALRAETREAVAVALAAAGATAILVTHDQSEALSMGEAVAVLREGRLVQVASPEMLYRRPLDVALARFVGEAVTLPGIAAHGRVCCRLGVLALSAPVADGAVEIVVRPEQLCLTAPDAADRCAIVGRVTFQGPDAHVVLAMADGVALAARVAGHHAPTPGTRVGIRVESSVMAYARTPARLANDGQMP